MRRFSIWIGLALLVTLCAPPAGAQANENQAWVRAATPSFELYTTGGEGEARAAILFLEQVRAFLQRNNAGLRLPAWPVRVVALRSEREFRAYAGADAAGGVLRRGVHHDTIVTAGLDAARYPALVREYLRSVTGRADIKVPLWLGQGLAEFYSSLKPAASTGSLRIGDIPAGHPATLARGPLLDLPALLGADEKWRAGVRPEQEAVFTAQSWALTHMLALGDAYRPKFPAFVAEALKGTASEEALQAVYGAPVAKVREDLRTYIRDAQYKAYILPYGTERQLGQSSLRVASAMEWNLALAELDAFNPERREEARRTYEKLAAANPQRWEPHAALGYLALASQDREAASRHFTRAEELDCPDAKMYLDWAALAPPSGDELVSIYRKAAALRPEDAETSYLAGLGLASAGDCEGSLRLLVPLKNVAADRQAAYSRAVQGCRVAEPNAASVAPVPAAAPAAPTLRTAEGQLVQIDCVGASARIWLQVAGRRLQYVISQGEAMTLIRGGREVTEDLRCGPQTPPAAVRVRFADPPAMEPGVAGAVLVLEFL